LPFSIRKGSRAALEGAAREQGREQGGALCAPALPQQVGA